MMQSIPQKAIGSLIYDVYDFNRYFLGMETHLRAASARSKIARVAVTLSEHTLGLRTGSDAEILVLRQAVRTAYDTLRDASPMLADEKIGWAMHDMLAAVEHDIFKLCSTFGLQFAGDIWMASDAGRNALDTRSEEPLPMTTERLTEVAVYTDVVEPVIRQTISLEAVVRHVPDPDALYHAGKGLRAVLALAASRHPDAAEVSATLSAVYRDVANRLLVLFRRVKSASDAADYRLPWHAGVRAEVDTTVYSSVPHDVQHLEIVFYAADIRNVAHRTITGTYTVKYREVAGNLLNRVWRGLRSTVTRSEDQRLTDDLVVLDIHNQKLSPPGASRVQVNPMLFSTSAAAAQRFSGEFPFLAFTAICVAPTLLEALIVECGGVDHGHLSNGHFVYGDNPLWRRIELPTSPVLSNIPALIDYNTDRPMTADKQANAIRAHPGLNGQQNLTPIVLIRPHDEFTYLRLEGTQEDGMVVEASGYVSLQTPIETLGVGLGGNSNEQSSMFVPCGVVLDNVKMEASYFDPFATPFARPHAVTLEQFMMFNFGQYFGQKLYDKTSVGGQHIIDGRPPPPPLVLFGNIVRFPRILVAGEIDTSYPLPDDSDDDSQPTTRIATTGVPDPDRFFN
jgi:hypothetical protein